MTTGQSGRRRGLVSWFVEPYRQVKLGMIFLVLNLIFSALILMVFGFYFYDVYKALTVYFSLTPDQGAEILTKLTTPIFVGFVLIGLFVVTTILASVRYTHEIYGPLVSIHRFLDSLLESKKPTPLQLRDSDQLKELAEKLNSVADLNVIGSRVYWEKIYDYIDALGRESRPEPPNLSGSLEFQTLMKKLDEFVSRKKNQNND